jgi:undecaprenyl-diphosphatase
MNIIAAIILGLVQGLTEFIPVSSSGHLIVFHEILRLQDGGLAFDVALHIGTLMALVVFFWKDIMGLVSNLFQQNQEGRLARIIALATIPAVLGGVLLEDLASSTFRSTLLVAVNLMLVAALMLFAEDFIERRANHKTLSKLSIPTGMAIGIAQVAALLPGVSRSGSTITAGLFAGLSREAAARFSFLLALPITFGAILKTVAGGDTFGHIQADPGPFIAGIIAAFVSGYVAIRFLLKFVAKHNLRPFAYYRIALGIGIILWLQFV